MSKPTKICQICLRADRSLKVVESKLSDFHDELCDYFITNVNPQYCFECEYLLKKLYNFKAKCLMAAKIIKRERKKNAMGKKPVNLLYTLLPPISLGFWTTKNAKIYTYEFIEDPVSNIQITTGPNTSNVNMTAPPISSVDITESSMCDVNILPTPSMSNFNTTTPISNCNMTIPISNVNITGPKMSNVNITGPTMSNVNITGPTMSNVNTTGPTMSNVNITGSTMSNVNITGPTMSNVNIPGSPVSNINTPINVSGPHIVLVPMGDLQNYCENQAHVEHTNINEHIKQELDCENDNKVLDLEDVLTFKTKEAILKDILKNDTNLNICENTERKRKNQIENYDIVNNVSDESDLNNDCNEIIDDVLENCSTSSDYNEEDKTSTSLITNTAFSKHCVSKLKSRSKKSHKNTYVNDFKNEDSKEISVKKTKIVDNIDKNNKRSATKRKVVAKDSQRSNTKKTIDRDAKIKQRFHTKRGILAELAHLADSDDEVLDKLKMKRSKVSFSKESLKSELKEKFACCGEITTDGITIDKEFIIGCVDDKVTEFVMKQLWNAVHATFSFKPQALKLFKSIQNKYNNEYDSVFEIEYLNTKEKMLEEFHKRKCYECYVNAEYKCEICYTGFKHEKKLEYHKKCHDESVGAFICPICNVRQKHKKSLISHFNSHEAVYKCKLCPLITYYKGSMVNHYELHKGVKFRCEPCDVTFGSRSAYRTHVSYRHQRRYICTACGRAFFSETGLKWHKTRSHQDEPPPPSTESDGAHCSECSLSFPSAEVYLRHVRITHETVTRGRKPGTVVTANAQRVYRPRKKPVFTCRVEISQRWYHVVRKPGSDDGILEESRESSNICNAVGNSIGWLTMHFTTEHPDKDMSLMYADKRTHLCHVCGKGFTSIYILNAHLNTHTGARPFACSVCPARFPRALSLRLHRALHAPPARPCPHCGKKFRSQSNLANHVRFHVGDRRYKCKICSKGFLHRSTLNEHVRGVHHNVRRVRKRTGGALGTGGCGEVREVE